MLLGEFVLHAMDSGTKEEGNGNKEIFLVGSRDGSVIHFGILRGISVVRYCLQPIISLGGVMTGFPFLSSSGVRPPA